ncbi:hypothetical protein [Salipiger sp. PrR003]|uniref:hypothetical protein n=1 Tax=Salipiger sp. PrR003 TaxID=2706776 RepID=UPI0013DACA8E|nr:hypothetical protein [Salipiger sp. PrR003]NDV53373.1 hypothetical protein [Salipiger sp. PrR003]
MATESYTTPWDVTGISGLPTPESFTFSLLVHIAPTLAKNCPHRHPQTLVCPGPQGMQDAHGAE